MSRVNLNMIRRLRVQNHFSIKDMARFLGYKSPMTYWRIETGRTQIKADQLKIIADVFKMPLDSFFVDRKETIILPPFPYEGKTDEQLSGLYEAIHVHRSAILNSDHHLEKLREEFERRGLDTDGLPGQTR